MIKSFFSTEEENTGIDWLDVAIALANILVAHIIQEIENGRLAESGKATVLKTVDMSKAYVGSIPTSSAID